MATYSDVYFGHYTTLKGNTWDFGTSKLTNVAEPLVATDVSTKNYVDTNRQTQGQNLRAYADAGDLTVSNAYKAADISLKAAVDAQIAAVQSQVSGILAGADVNTDSLKEIADLAKTLNAAETATLTSAVAALQSQITSNDTDITSLKTLTTGYATEFDTAKLKYSSFIDIEDGIFNNSIKTDPNTGNLILSTPTANGSCVVNIPTNFFLTDTIGATSYQAVQFNNAIDMAGYYKTPNKIVNLADAVDTHDATAYHQLTDYQTSNDAAVAAVVSNLGIEAFARDAADNTLQSNIDTNYSNTVKLDGTGPQIINSDISVLNFTANGLSAFNSTVETFDLVKHNGAVVFGADANICLNDNEGPFLKKDGFYGWAAASRSDDVAQYGQLQSEVSRATAAEQALTARVLVLEGQMAALYQYLYNSSPTVPPRR
jgi:hypothetical protein